MKVNILQFNLMEKKRVTRDQILLLKSEMSCMMESAPAGAKSGGFLPLLGMIPSIIGGIGKLFTGQGLDFLLDEEGNEKKDEILPALGAL